MMPLGKVSSGWVFGVSQCLDSLECWGLFLQSQPEPCPENVAMNEMPSPFQVCDGACCRGPESEDPRERGWKALGKVGVFYQQINLTLLNYQRASHHSLSSKGKGKLFITQYEANEKVALCKTCKVTYYGNCLQSFNVSAARLINLL